MMKKTQLLVVDDSAELLDSMVEILEMNFSDSIKVVKAQNGKEAFEELKKEKIDILITDETMPIMNGEELIVISQKEYFYNKLKAVFLISPLYDLEGLQQRFPEVKVISKMDIFNSLIPELRMILDH